MAEIKTDKAQQLAEISLFRDVDEQERRKLEQRCLWASYDAGAQIISHLDDTNDVYFLTEGTARAVIYAESGKMIAFRDIRPGEFFGEYSAIDNKQRSASIEAISACCCARMPRAVFLEVLSNQAVAGYALNRHLVQQVRKLTERIYEFSTLAAQNRIQAELLRLGIEQSTDGKFARIQPAPTHADIASRISTHREAVTRELNRLVKLGIIKQKRRLIEIDDLAKLEEMVRNASNGMA